MREACTACPSSLLGKRMQLPAPLRRLFTLEMAFDPSRSQPRMNPSGARTTCTKIQVFAYGPQISCRSKHKHAIGRKYHRHLSSRSAAGPTGRTSPSLIARLGLQRVGVRGLDCLIRLLASSASCGGAEQRLAGKLWGVATCSGVSIHGNALFTHESRRMAFDVMGLTRNRAH